MAEGQTPERPPTSGRGSSVDAWRAYAAAFTESPLESWAAMSREDIIELLDSEGSNAGAEQDAGGESSDGAGDQPDGLTDTEREADRNSAAARDELAVRHPPVWMVPTDDGYVPEHTLRKR